MATTSEILDAARNLGKLVASHEAAHRFEKMLTDLEADVDAQRLVSDLNRHMAELAEKESQGQPIEVADKRQLADLQTKVSRHALLRDLQLVQMDYLDLMRGVDEAISEQGPGKHDAHPIAADSQ